MGYWYFTSPKYKSYRVIDIDDVLVSILKEEYEKQKRDEEYYGEFYKKYYSEFQLLFSVQKNKEKEIPLNEVSTKETDFGVDFVCRREDGSYFDFIQTEKVTDTMKARSIVAYFTTEDGEKISFDVPMIANSREDAPEKRTFHEKFTLNRPGSGNYFTC